MTKLLYKPLGMLAGVLGGLAASVVFARVWKLLTGEDDAPAATDRDRTWGEIVAAAALQGAVFATVRAVVDRGGATGFRKVTGTWPGAER